MKYVPYHSGIDPSLFETDAEPIVHEPISFSITAPVTEVFYIRFHTNSYAPNHIITIRNNIDGWERDVFGRYYEGSWEFAFKRTNYPDGFEVKFVLDQRFFMTGENIWLPPHTDHYFDESSVQFPNVIPRYRHGYDNLHVMESPFQQTRVRPNTNERILYDVIIIGSGMGGGILADQLSDRGIKTLLLEAGGLTYPSHITNLPGNWGVLPARHQVGHFVNEPGSHFMFGVQMGLGGRSVFWSGLIPRMRDWELGFWPDNVRAYLKGEGYDRAEHLLRKRKTLGGFQNQLVKNMKRKFRTYQIEDLPRSSHQPNVDEQNNIGNVLQRSTGVFSTADLLLDSMSFDGPAGRDNLTINLHHMVTGIHTSGTTATEVVCQDLVGNTERRYRARYIVLAAGSLESPKIALQSTLRDPNGKIGRGLTDHPAFFSTRYLLPADSEYAGLQNHAKIMLAHKKAKANAHAFNTELLLGPQYWDVRLADDDLWQQEVAAQQHTLVSFTFVFDSHLDDNNYIRLRGPGEKPAVRVQPNGRAWEWNFPQETRDLRNELLTFLQATNEDGSPFNPDQDMYVGNNGTVHHAGGTLRMSGDGTGVVDETLKFENYTNLYACDVSVFPHIPAANPVLTLAALSLRLADTLAERLGG